MKSFRVKVGKGYDIMIQRGIINDCAKYIKNVSNAKKIVVVSDTNVSPLYFDSVKNCLDNEGYEVFKYVFEAGEKSKNINTVMGMVEYMAQNELTRSDLVIALGGGVCGDMAGFAASIYLRGIDFIQIPTSLLAQVDSSVGGKTAVDLPQGKNLCGAFHQPVLVLIDPNTLDTLSDHFFSDGMAEVIKMGCIKSENLFARLEKENPKDFIEDIIYECVSLKAQVVESDEKELGLRALLNFGHTAGHAIEKLHGFTTITHGYDVGIGMVMIVKACENAKITELGTSDRIINVLKKNNLDYSDNNSVIDIVEAMSSDKKRTANAIKFVVIDKIGSSYIKTIDNENIANFFGV